MELDDLKASWQRLHADVAKVAALQLELGRAQGLDRLRRSLRPLRHGQGVQMALGALLALWAGGFWIEHRAVPHLLLTGLVFHAYGIALLAFGIRLRLLLGRLEADLPVVELQRRLAEARCFYTRVGLHALGLPWWALWLPLLAMALMSLFGADLYVGMGAAYSLTLGVCALGWALTLLAGRWAKGRPGLAAHLEAVVTGASLRRAEAALSEIARFQAE